MTKIRSYRGGVALCAAAFAACILVPSILPGTLQAETQATAKHGALELTSPLGRKLYALPDGPAIAAAKANLAKDPQNVSLVLQLSKAQAGQRQYREAVATCTKGLVFAPSDTDLYIERGHRELGLRRFRAAMIDLEHAATLDPRKLDASYHLALSHYFVGEFDEAAHYFRAALDLAQSDDSIIDCSNWLYVSLRRAGKKEEAAQVLTRITPQMKNTEPHLAAYLRLLRFYQGAISEQDVLVPKPADPNDVEAELGFDTTSYGIGNWHLYNGEIPASEKFFQSVVTGEAWNAWGFIGSETDLVRMNQKGASSGHS
jgi:tetratricopeptide (TPR) repeat protein